MWDGNSYAFNPVYYSQFHKPMFVPKFETRRYEIDSEDYQDARNSILYDEKMMLKKNTQSPDDDSLKDESMEDDSFSSP
jgi:lysine/ornithine N-monooxygenase